MTESEAESVDVFLEYRLTSALLSLVMTQDPTLFGPYDPPLDYSVPARRRVLNAFSNILVRNVDTVAVTTSGFEPPPGGSTSVDTPNTLNVLVMQEENRAESTVVPNSQPSGLLAPGKGPWLTTIAPGQSKWAEIMASPWSCLTKPNEILSLSDHLATVEEYLNEYQLSRRQPAEPNDDIRVKQFNSFFIYIVSTFYPRVRRQLSNSLSKKLFSLLSSITGPQLEQRLDVESFDSQTSEWNNLHLCRVVHLAPSGENPYDFQAMVQELKAKHYQFQNQSPTEEPDKRKASPLFDALSQTFELVKSVTTDPSQLPILYTKETSVDFHYFLLFALTKYSDAVIQFYDHVMDGSPTDKVRRDLRVYSSLLWRLAHSSVLSDHLKFVCKCMPYNFISSDVTENAQEIGGGEVLEDEEASSDDGGVREEMAAIEGDLKHRRDPVLMIQRWLWLLVSHLQAFHFLSSCASMAPPTVVRIQHVVAKTTQFEAPQDWTAVLKRALADREGSFRLLSKYNRLEELILGMINATHEGGSGEKGIFRYFKGKNILSGCGHVHCEAGLAAELHSPPQSDIMEEIGFEGNFLTASRRCCTLCWELLGYLRTDRFGVRSQSHSPPTPMELPGWICWDSAEELLQSLRDTLNMKLRSLLIREDDHRDASAACDDVTRLDLRLAALFAALHER